MRLTNWAVTGIMLAILMGCAGGGTSTPVQHPGPEQLTVNTPETGSGELPGNVSPVTGIEPVVDNGSDSHSGLPAFPSGDSDVFSPVHKVSEVGRQTDGTGYVDSFGANNRDGATAGEYVLIPKEGSIAWAMYSIANLTGDRPVRVDIEVMPTAYLPGGDDDLPLSYWIGIANYTQYKWEWLGPFTEAQALQINSEELRDRYVSKVGTLHWVAVLYGGEADLPGITLQSGTVVIDTNYFANAPHFTLIDSIDVGSGGAGGGGGKSASALDPSQYIVIDWSNIPAFSIDDEINEAIQYRVYRRGPTDLTPQIVDTQGTTETTYTDPTDNGDDVDPPIPGATYRYYIRAINLNGFTPLSPPVEATVPLYAATDIAATDGTYGSQIVLTWTKAQDATSYEVYRDGQEPVNQIATVGDVDIYTDLDPTILDGDQHTYWLIAVNDFASSGFSEPDTGYVEKSIPVADLHTTPDPPRGDIPLTVDFDASASYDPDNGAEPGIGIVKYEFDFGEGGGWENNGINPTAQHEYLTDEMTIARVRVTDDDGDTGEDSVAISGDQLICYSAMVDEQWGIYSMNSDGSEQTLVTPCGEAGHAVWSPDRGHIAFTNKETGLNQIWVVNADGTEKTQVTDDGLNNQTPCWQDNSFLIYTQVDASPDTITRINIDGTQLEALSPNNMYCSDPWLSPDGYRITYSASEDGNDPGLYVADYPSFANAVEIVDNSNGLVRYPCWSTSGYLTMSVYSTGWSLYKSDDDGANLTQVAGNAEYSTIATGGAQIVYATPHPNRHIYRIDSDGTGIEQLTSGIYAMWPDWYIKRWPDANLAATPAEGTFPHAVSFDASASYDMDNGTGDGLGITDYEWDFDGDGEFNESGDEADAQGQATSQFTYEITGAYNSTVRVTDDEGDTNIAVVEILVHCPPFTHTWGRTESEGGSDVAIDNVGNVYVVGGTFFLGAGGVDCLLMKYDATGSLLWTRSWGGATHESLSEIALDSDGNIYVAGDGYSFSVGDQDYIILKYNSDGTLLWARTWGLSSWDILFDIAVDGGGNILVAGRTGNYVTGDCLLLKYDPTGVLVWEKTWGGFEFSNSQAIVIDDDGNIFLAGDTSYGAGSSDSLLLKYDSTGELQWQKAWGTTGQEYSTGIALDSNGGIYLATYSGSLGSGGGDSILLKYDSSGNLVWQKAWGGSSNYEVPNEIAIDNNNNIYLSGYTRSFGAGNDDIFFLKYDSTGNLVVQSVWGGTELDRSWGGLQVSSAGDVHIAGKSPDNTGTWESVTGIAQDVSGTVEELSGVASTTTGTVLSPTGTEDTPTGTEDTGGGGSDVLIMRFDPDSI